MAKEPNRRTVTATKVHQWLRGWEKVDFSAAGRRRKPQDHFYLFALPAAELRSLCGISRRQASGVKARKEDLGIQRQHEKDRSDEISRFVDFGYPWSILSEARRRLPEFNDLRKPGWLPTAVVLNILGKGEEREGLRIADQDIVTVSDADGTSHVTLPYGRWSRDWKPRTLPPFEVIDGQHRLWAFGNETEAATFELPVVAFCGLDISWQAYLFWTINIKPKRINPSLAFDLYPLLRTEDWLDRAEAHPIYRETRAQELTEALWSYPKSPWYDRINMLGEKEIEWVSQSAWIRSLTATFVRPWEGRGARPGGLFGSRIGEEGEVLAWNRAQQSAFLIFAWQEFKSAVRDHKGDWSRSLRGIDLPKKSHLGPADDLAFYGPHSLIMTDQGVRGFLQVLNDICFVSAPRLKLDTWRGSGRPAANDVQAIDTEMRSLSKQPVAKTIIAIARGLASFDWRTSSAPGLEDDERKQKLVFRGSSGYGELWRQLLTHLSLRDDDVGKAAKRFTKPGK